VLRRHRVNGGDGQSMPEVFGAGIILWGLFLFAVFGARIARRGAGQLRAGQRAGLTGIGHIRP
jgi:hypothetical protein